MVGSDAIKGKIRSLLSVPFIFSHIYYFIQKITLFTTKLAVSTICFYAIKTELFQFTPDIDFGDKKKLREPGLESRVAVGE